jgi:predicted dehydrogenase
MTSEQAQVWDLAPPYFHIGGKLWLAKLPPELYDETDTNEAPRRSELRLLENGRPLQSGHAVHEIIERVGGGSYSFWKGTLYFSTPDDSDPNRNGRRYRAELQKAESVPDLSSAQPAVRRWVPPARPIRCAVLGLGNRGLHLARMAKSFAGVDVTWVVDVSALRLNQAVKSLGDKRIATATDWRAAVEDPSVDAVLVTLPDFLHRPAAEAAFTAGKHVYLEKPIATNVEDAKIILQAWQRSGRTLQVGYVLRQTPFYSSIREFVQAGVLGCVRMIHTGEQLDVKHGASFMRRWHSDSSRSGGLIVHKCCHDLDLICWMLDTRASRVASFGGRATFARPAPAAFCSQCQERSECMYADEGTHEHRTPEEKADPTAFGLDRCVFGDDKDIVDNQVVAFELASGVRGSHHLMVQGRRTERRITIIGDLARLDGVLEDGTFTVEFAQSDRKPIRWSADGADAGAHMGGDARTIHNFFDGCSGWGQSAIGTPDQIVAGLALAAAAETARKGGRVVLLSEDQSAVGLS